MSKLNKSIGLIGSGNMGEALMAAVIHSDVCDPKQVCTSDIDPARLSVLKKRYGISVTEDNHNLFSQSDIVILSIKPQQMNQVLSEIAQGPGYTIRNRKLVISIAAGITLDRIESTLYAPLDDASRQRLPIIRVMPNTPALVLAGMSGMTANRNATVEDLRDARTILEAMGHVLEFPESSLDAVTALSGSGPAYVFYFVEAMIAGGIGVGLKPDEAKTLTLTTLKGALRLLEEKDESPESLRRKVTSPGGTTEAALELLETGAVKQTVIMAIAAAARRSVELSKQ